MADFRFSTPPPLEVRDQSSTPSFYTTSSISTPPVEEVSHDIEISEEDGPSFLSYLIRWLVFLGIIAILIYAIWFFFFKPSDNKREVTQTIPQAISLRTNEKIIGRKGGEVKLRDGASIFVPEGSLDRDILMSIEKIEEGRVTALYHLKPDRLKFIKPVIITIPYNGENLRSEENPFQIRLFTGEEKNSLQKSLTTSVNPLSMTLRAEMIEF